jgi:hypothetical protein
MSGPCTENCRLPPVGDILAPWWEFLERHANDATNGLCSECKVEYCERWCARERLAGAGILRGALPKLQDASEPTEPHP